MFGNRLVNYGGGGGVRRGLIWQSGRAGAGMDMLSGHIIDNFRSVVDGRFTYGRMDYIDSTYTVTGRTERLYENHGQGKHIPEYDPVSQALYMRTWDTFSLCPRATAAQKTAYNNLVRTQWGGFNPTDQPYYNDYYLGPSFSSSSRLSSLKLPNFNFYHRSGEANARMGFYYVYVNFSTAQQAFLYFNNYLRVNGTTEFYIRNFSATRFSKDVYTIVNALPYTGGPSSGITGQCDVRIADPVIISAYDIYLDYDILIHLRYVPVPVAYIIIDT